MCFCQFLRGIMRSCSQVGVWKSIGVCTSGRSFKERIGISGLTEGAFKRNSGVAVSQQHINPSLQRALTAKTEEEECLLSSIPPPVYANQGNISWFIKGCIDMRPASILLDNPVQMTHSGTRPRATITTPTTPSTNPPPPFRSVLWMVSGCIRIQTHLGPGMGGLSFYCSNI